MILGLKLMFNLISNQINLKNGLKHFNLLVLNKLFILIDFNYQLI